MHCSVVYKSAITAFGKIFEYIMSIALQLERYIANHEYTHRHSNLMNSISLSKFIWHIKQKEPTYVNCVAKGTMKVHRIAAQKYLFCIKELLQVIKVRSKFLYSKTERAITRHHKYAKLFKECSLILAELIPMEIVIFNRHT